MAALESSPSAKTGRTVSRLGFGGAPAGLANYLGRYSYKDVLQRQSMVEAIQRAQELGVTYFDTAAGYGDGASERIFGDGLAGRASEVFIATKVGHGEADPRAVVERSLVNLRVPVLDLVQVHGTTYSDDLADRLLGPDGTVAVLERMRDEGLIRHIGFTTEDQNSAVYRFIKSGRFDVMQICYNVVHMHAHEFTRPFGSIPAAVEAGMGVVTMRTLTSGMFQKWMRTIRPDDDFDYSTALLQFVLSDPMVNVALVGTRTAGEVERNVAVLHDKAGRIDLEDIHGKYV